MSEPKPLSAAELNDMRVAVAKTLETPEKWTARQWDMSKTLERMLATIDALTAESTRARDEIARLTAERDEARGERDAALRVQNWIDNNSANLGIARAALERIAAHPTADALILTAQGGHPMIGVGTFAKDTLASFRALSNPE